MSDEAWRAMDSATLDAAYDNFAACADAQTHLDRWDRLAAEMRGTASATLDLAYGPRLRNRVDLFAGGPADAPLFAFIHGVFLPDHRSRSDGKPTHVPSPDSVLSNSFSRRSSTSREDKLGRVSVCDRSLRA